MNWDKVGKNHWLLFTIIIFCSCGGYAQSGTWVWMNGSDTANSPGNYGIQGNAADSNSPPALYQAVQWTDKNGNFWLYGGLDYNEDEYSDLWKYDPVAYTWTWVSGPGGITNMPAVNGTLGVPSINNTPGARGWGCSSWTDTSGDLWLFGGMADRGVSLNDLWRYSIVSNEWTWMGGAGSSSYGTLHQLSNSSWPPVRYEDNTAWTDVNNNLWLFGGTLFDQGSYNDIWRYNISSGQWAWMGGSETLNAPINYGTLGLESAENNPGARWSYTHWMEGNYLYLTGGYGWNAGLNDVWRYNLNTNYWTWVGGDTGDVPNGIYNNYCSINNGNEPGGRYEHRSVQLNGCSPVLFMYGGFADGGPMNDLWSFNTQHGQWIWVSGSGNPHSTGNYGALRVGAPGNVPPGSGGICFWTDKSGNLWVWGGWTINVMFNAMWEYIPDLPCFPADSGIGALDYELSKTIICRGDSAMISFVGDADVTISPANYVTWVDSFHAILDPDTTTVFSISGNNTCVHHAFEQFTLGVFNGTVNLSPADIIICSGDTAQICADQGFTNYAWNNGDSSACMNTTLAGNYAVTVTTSGNCSATSNEVSITLHPPFSVVISVSGDTLRAYNGVTYQWYLNDTILTGNTSNFLIAQRSGFYAVVETDTNGCTASSTLQHITITGIENELPESSITIFPNPASTGWHLNVKYGLLGSTIAIFDAAGRLVYNSTIVNTNTHITIPNAAPGVYELRITSDEYNAVRKLVKL